MLTKLLKSKKGYNEKAITLIALVVTIVIMLILAGITIGTTTNLMSRTSEAKILTAISNIKEENINLSTGLIRLMGKGSKERYVQISNPSVLAVLKQYYKENKAAIKNSGFFFVNNRGNRFTE